MNLEKKKLLVEKSKWLRREIFEIVIRARKGHIPSSYSITELLTCLFYNGHVNIENFKNQNEKRDKVIVSKGHAAMAIYPVLKELEMVTEKDILEFTKKDCLLRMYADHSIPGVETVTGSLGNGYGIGAGLAFAQKRKGVASNIFAILGDGECYEGSVWETALFISEYNLDNLITFVDRNQLCIMGETEKLIALDPLDKKWRSFGFKTYSIDGHNHEEISSAINDNSDGKPKAIILNTVKGKGISFMEGKHLWHNRMPSPEEEKIAREELGFNNE